MGKHSFTSDIDRLVSLLKDSAKKGREPRRHLEGASALARKMSAKLKAANCDKEAHTASEVAGCVFMALAERGPVQPNSGPNPDPAPDGKAAVRRQGCRRAR